MILSTDPKKLRAMARDLNAMAQSIEMSRDPHAFMQKKRTKSNVSSMKRQMKAQILKKIGF